MPGRESNAPARAARACPVCVLGRTPLSGRKGLFARAGSGRARTRIYSPAPLSAAVRAHALLQCDNRPNAAFRPAFAG